MPEKKSRAQIRAERELESIAARSQLKNADLLSGANQITVWQKLSDAFAGWSQRRSAMEQSELLEGYKLELSLGNDALLGRVKSQTEQLRLVKQRRERDLRVSHENRLKAIDGELVFGQEHLKNSQAKRERDKQLFTEEREEAKNTYLEWRRIVKRAPFSDMLSTSLSDEISRRESDRAASERGNDQRGDSELPTTWRGKAYKFVVDLLSEWMTPIKSFVKTFWPYLIFLPAEVQFSYPAFSFLMENNILVGLAAALVFTFLLMRGGESIGLFIKRSLSSTPNANEITKKPRWFSIFAAILLISFTFWLSYAGAQLRTTLPEITGLDRKIRMVSTDASSRALQGLPPDENAKSLDDLQAQRVTILALPSDVFGRRDGQIAFSIYFGIVLLMGIKRVLEVDPIFEYGLAAGEHNGFRQLGRTIDAVYNATSDFIELQQARLKIERESLMSRGVDDADDVEQAIQQSIATEEMMRKCLDEVLRSRMHRYRRWLLGKR